jgi:hypothetical protein
MMSEKLRSGVAGSTMLAAGIAVLLFGAGPLLLYGLFGPADGNPIGLGLMMIVAVPVGGMLIAFGLLKMLIAWLVGRSA